MFAASIYTRKDKTEIHIQQGTAEVWQSRTLCAITNAAEQGGEND